MPNLVKVSLSEPQQNSSIHLAVATNEIMKAGMKALAIRAVPDLRRLIARIYEHRLAVPILAFTGQVAAALEKENPLAGLRQTPSHGAAARARADNDNIVMFASWSWLAPGTRNGNV